MRDKLNTTLNRAKTTFGAFTAGQKAVAIVGTGALLIAAFMVFRWVSTPNYAPLYSGLSGEDASAVIDELTAEGVPYKITDGGGTVMVPRSDVYSTRITLSGKGLPSDSGSGYSLLDDQDISTSQFKEQTDFKRAMEGELATTIEAIDGVKTAVVHLAMPEKKVFSDEQAPATASVLIDTTPGTSISPEQVSAIVNLVAASIDSLDPKNVTVADSTGKVLSSTNADGSMNNNNQDVVDFQSSMQQAIQAQLDRVVGPGNSSTIVTPTLDFDKSTTETREYLQPKKDAPPLTYSEHNETYNGDPNASTANGVVGPDGEMDPGTTGTTNGDGSYSNSDRTADNPYGQRYEKREAAPGAVEKLNVSVAVDATAAANVQPDTIKSMIASAVGIDTKRGDTIEVTYVPFDRSAEDSAAQELAKAAAAEAKAKQMTMIRNIGIAGLIALLVLLAWWQARRRAMAREEATSYVVEQLRADQAARISEPAPAVAALEVVEETEDERIREELLSLVEKQPDDVAALLRGWLVEAR